MGDKRRILIVDPSRVVRSTLVKHLREDFDIREESDGESAWQSLVLDASISAVVAGVHLARINGHELLARLRENSLRRLSDLPFFLIISSDETPDNRQQAKERGVSDFIVRGMPADEICTRVGRLVNWDLPGDSAPAKPTQVPAAQPDFAGREALLAFLEERRCDAQGSPLPVSILAFGLEGEATISSNFGQQTLQDIARRIAQVIQQKIGRKDLMGRIAPACYAIVSPGTSQASSLAFAQRVCRALGERSVQVGKLRMQIGVSAGIASQPADPGRDAGQLLDLAQQRLERARQAPGGQVVDSEPAENPAADDIFSPLRELLHQGGTGAQLGFAGLQLMPLMRLFEQEFHLGLPLREMETRFKDHATRKPAERTAASDHRHHDT